MIRDQDIITILVGTMKLIEHRLPLMKISGEYLEKTKLVSLTKTSKIILSSRLVRIS